MQRKTFARILTTKLTSLLDNKVTEAISYTGSGIPPFDNIPRLVQIRERGKSKGGWQKELCRSWWDFNELALHSTCVTGCKGDVVRPKAVECVYNCVCVNVMVDVELKSYTQWDSKES
ncbi:hypothetical protein NC651_022333 [Populus alba x Populus x berolinensis]|nr:hypothetical protein NC651_022333 [Populus alba x Populus x berolinensis]